MSVAIPTATYGFGSGGVAVRKLSKQPLIPSASGGIVYLPGGIDAQPITPGVLGSWGDTGSAAFLKGYVAFDLAAKVIQGGNTTSVTIDVLPTHGGGLKEETALISQHVIKIPEFFKPASSVRGAGLKGRFELANRDFSITTNSTYPGVVGVTLSDRAHLYEHVSGASDPNPNDVPFSNGVAKILTRVYLVNSSGSLLSTLFSSSSAPTVSNHDESLQAAPLFSSSVVSMADTTPNNRNAAYIVVEIGASITASGNNFVYGGGGTWWESFSEQRVDLSFDDSDDALMAIGDTVQFTTFLGLYDQSSGLDTSPLSDYDQHLRASSR